MSESIYVFHHVPRHRFKRNVFHCYDGNSHGRTLMSDQELEISDQWQTKEALEALQGIDGISVAALPTFVEFYYMINTIDFVDFGFGKSYVYRRKNSSFSEQIY